MADSKMGRDDVHIYSCIDDLTTELAEYISDLSEKSVKERGYFTIALSGRSTIKLIWQLTGPPYLIMVDWSKWHIFFADERAVAKSHPESNYKLAKDEFLSKVPIPSSHICSINDVEVGMAANEYQFTIRQHVKLHKVAASVSTDCPRFDLILLELGSDGHVASLFPGHAALYVAHDWVTHIMDSPQPPPERITFTIPVINSACNVAIVAVGGDKADAVRFSVASTNVGGHGDLDDDKSVDAYLSPARMVNPVDGRLVWFLDSCAASKLN